MKVARTQLRRLIREMVIQEVDGMDAKMFASPTTDINGATIRVIRWLERSIMSHIQRLRREGAIKPGQDTIMFKMPRKILIDLVNQEFEGSNYDEQRLYYEIETKFKRKAQFTQFKIFHFEIYNRDILVGVKFNR